MKDGTAHDVITMEYAKFMLHNDIIAKEYAKFMFKYVTTITCYQIHLIITLPNLKQYILSFTQDQVWESIPKQVEK